MYREIAHRLHPDIGGDNHLMALLNESYLNALDDVKSTKRKRFNISECEETDDDIYDGDERLDIIVRILEYAESNPRYNAKFTCSVADYLELHGYVTAAQYNALLKSYYAFKMDKTDVGPERKRA